MKSLFIISITFGIFTANTLTSKAQTNVSTEKFDDGTKQNNNSKYIVNKDAITVTQGNTSANNEKVSKSDQPVASVPAFIKPGYVSNIELCTALQFKYAMLMDIEVESITNLPLYKFIDEWWGTSYKYGGADHSGIDCSSFTCKILSDVYGLNAPRTAKDQYTKCEKITIDNLEEGNLVFFNTSGGVSHVGLYLGNNYFVHSSLNGGVTISSLKEEYYSRKFISGGRIMFPPTPLASSR